MYPRVEFLEAGGFDEDYFAYHEDVDLGFRMRLRGLRCYLVQAASVQHVGSASTGRRSGFAVYHGHRNLVWTYAKNMPSPWVWLYLPLAHRGKRRSPSPTSSSPVMASPYFALSGTPCADCRVPCPNEAGCRQNARCPPPRFCAT